MVEGDTDPLSQHPITGDELRAFAIPGERNLYPARAIALLGQDELGVGRIGLGVVDEIGHFGSDGGTHP